jgi:aminoglycoside phosphotransferase (APT) family kinase protein
VVFDEAGRAGLLDFDTMCRAEPALDLGHFCAYLRVACHKAERAASSSASLGPELSERFLLAYIEACGSAEDPGCLRPRVAAYEAVSLLRMSLHRWHQLKAARTSDVLTVLSERVRWLAASVH